MLYYNLNAMRLSLYIMLLDKNLDFFITLCSLYTVIGIHGQSNYAVEGTHQDMFVHSDVSAG